MHNWLFNRTVWENSVYAVLVYRESFPVEVADGALCWSAEVTAQHHFTALMRSENSHTFQ